MVINNGKAFIKSDELKKFCVKPNLSNTFCYERNFYTIGDIMSGGLNKQSSIKVYASKAKSFNIDTIIPLKSNPNSVYVTGKVVYEKIDGS